MADTVIIPRHQWTHDGEEVLIVKQVNKDGSTEVGCGDGSDGKLKADTWYVLDAAGQFTEAK